jgi:catechol-2,3-dioxygenase
VSARSRGQSGMAEVLPTELAVSGVVQNVRRLKDALYFSRDLLGLTVLRREQAAAVLGPLGLDRATLTLHEVRTYDARAIPVARSTLWARHR